MLPTVYAQADVGGVQAQSFGKYRKKSIQT